MRLLRLFSPLIYASILAFVIIGAVVSAQDLGGILDSPMGAVAVLITAFFAVGPGLFALRWIRKLIELEPMRKTPVDVVDRKDQYEWLK
tara:strand:+ start:473 stop:739 length:267 start_codon:yes stop_codon:yes gene_type:complete